MNSTTHYQLIGTSGIANDVHYTLSKKKRAHFPAGTLFIELSAAVPRQFNARIIMTYNQHQYQDTINVSLTPAVTSVHPIAHVVQIIGEKRAVFDDIHQTVANLSMHLECNQDTTSTRVV